MDAEKCITEMSRTIRAWAIARTPTLQEAEDLSQDVLLAMLRAAPDLRDEGAFYGFMWGVADNVYRTWLRKRRRTVPQDELAGAAPSFEEDVLHREQLTLLRRELALLSRQHRQAAVLHYVQGMRVREVAQVMGLSPSMVKYLLFKTRNIIKEGMDMERNYGAQAYAPRHLELRYWGEGPNDYYGAASTLLRQNILFACCNDALTAQQLALAIGVGLPYMEDDLYDLARRGLLTVDGAGRYRTNIIIFSEDFAREAACAVSGETRAIADRLVRCIREDEAAFRAVGFSGCGMNEAACVWQMVTMALYQACFERLPGVTLPLDHSGIPCLCWGVEATATPAADDFCMGVTTMEDEHGTRIRCMDFPINGPMVHHHLVQPTVLRVLLAIARGEAPQSENDAAIAAELVRKGYVLRQADALQVNCPVMTPSQLAQVQAILAPAAEDISTLTRYILEKEGLLLAEHAPAHLQDAAANLVWFRIFDDAIARPLALMHLEHTLPSGKLADLLPSACVVLPA